MLGIVSFFTDAASEMIYPLVPVFVAALGSGAIVLGVIEGVAETTAALLKLFSGILSDKLGKRKLLVLIGYAISSFVRPLTGLVTAAGQIVLVRMFDRVGKGIRTAPRDALIAAAVNERIRGKAYGFHRALDHAGAVAGPLLAIAVLLVLFIGFKMDDPLQVLRWTFLAAIIPGTLAVLLIVFFVQDVAPAQTGNQPFRLARKNFDKNFINYLFIMILFTLGNSSDAFLLFRVEEAIHKSGAVLKVVNNIEPLRALIAGFGAVETQARVINILFLPLVWAFFHVIKVLFSTPLGALPASIIFGFLYTLFDIKYPGYGGTVAFGFGGLVALVAMLLLALVVREPVKPVDD